MIKRNLIILLLIISGCATVQGYRMVLSTWIGHHTDELIVSWGPPTSITQLSNGGKLLQYIKVRTEQSGGFTYLAPVTSQTNVSAFGTGGNASGTATTTSYTPVNIPVRYKQFTCTTNFRINEQNIITSWNFNGNDCRARAPKNRVNIVEEQNEVITDFKI